MRERIGALCPSAVSAHALSHRKEKLMAKADRDGSTMIGVFVDQAEAEQAVHELRSAGFSDDQIHLVVHRAPGMGEEIITDEKRMEAGERRTDEAPGLFTGKPEGTRTVVTVQAAGGEKETPGHFALHGGNKADIP